MFQQLDDDTILIIADATNITLVIEYYSKVTVKLAADNDLNLGIDLDPTGIGESRVLELIKDQDFTVLKNIDCDASVYVGSFVRINTSGIAVNAIADTYSNSNVIGLVESKSSSTKCDIRVSGVSLPIYSGLNADYDYFLSDTVAGLLTDTVPTTSGHIKIKLGQAFGTDKFVMAKGERVVRL